MEDFKTKLKRLNQITLSDDANINRMQRMKISELRKEGEHIFLSVGRRHYKRIELCTREQKDKYINGRLSSMNTQYFNSVKPIERFMTKEQLDFIHNGGLFSEEIE